MNWLSIALKALPYLICLALGGIGIHKWDQGSYERLQASFSQYQAQVADASVKAEEARVKQHKDDIEHSQGAINDLKSELEALRASSAAAPPHVRLCQSAKGGSVSPSATGTSTGRSEPSSTASGDIRSVPEGLTLGPDIGAALFGLAASADVVSANCRAQLDYLRLITHNGPQ